MSFRSRDHHRSDPALKVNPGPRESRRIPPPNSQIRPSTHNSLIPLEPPPSSTDHNSGKVRIWSQQTNSSGGSTPQAFSIPAPRSTPRRRSLQDNPDTTPKESSTPSRAPEPSLTSMATTPRSKQSHANSSTSSTHASPTPAGGSPIIAPRRRPPLGRSPRTSKLTQSAQPPAQCASTALRTSTPPCT